MKVEIITVMESVILEAFYSFGMFRSEWYRIRSVCCYVNKISLASWLCDARMLNTSVNMLSKSALLFWMTCKWFMSHKFDGINGFFCTFRHQMAMWKPKSCVSSGGVTCRTHLSCWPTNIKVSTVSEFFYTCMQWVI